MLQNLKKIIPNKWKIFFDYYRYKDSNSYFYSKGDPKVIVALAADYGNLGDVAITKAQISFLKKLFNQHKIIYFPASDTYHKIINLKRLCTHNDIITIIGGGNMGDMYQSFEECRRTVIECFPNNKIVSFPQTIDFSKTREGIKQLKKSKKVYSKHNNLHIFARDPLSYKMMKTYFKKNDVHLVPDIVLSLNKCQPVLDRRGIIMCFRNDSESIFSKEVKSKLIELVNAKYNHVTFYDTHIGDDNFKVSKADEELNKIWIAFKSCKVVITDRLHGMIFCAITKTPCIVLPNSNHKITGSYNEWLWDLDYIRLVENFDLKEIMHTINELIKIDLENYKELNLKNKYQSLVTVLKG